MLKPFIEKVINFRNPGFKFADDIPRKHLMEFSLRKAFCYFRSYKILIHFRFPGWLFLASNVRFEGLSNITWGRWVQIGSGTLLSAYGNSKLIIGDNVSIGSYSRFIVTYSLSNPGLFIKIGHNVGIGDFSHIGGGGGVEIGDDTITGPYFSCHPTEHVFDDPDKPIRLQGVTRRGIKIGKNCWIGAKVTVLDGVTIGDNCIIGAGSVVKGCISSGSVAVGAPAKVIKTNVGLKS